MPHLTRFLISTQIDLTGFLSIPFRGWNCLLGLWWAEQSHYRVSAMRQAATTFRLILHSSLADAVPLWRKDT
ncbi:MAG: hypothetical protein QOJ42_3293 [Acidobacteriaceae bacterium]|nr:hypothetical protein [Acidobacteriaceae bacterium]